MREFPQLFIDKSLLIGDTLSLDTKALNRFVFDENTIGENISKISLKSTKEVDFVVIMRQKEHLITYIIEPYTKGKITFIFEKEDVVSNREIVMREGSELQLLMPDFKSGKRQVKIKTVLAEKFARVVWKLSSFSVNNDNKKFAISFAHYGPGSFADMYNYGVVLNASTLIFTGDSTIYENVKGAETHQTARIIVFDEGSLAQADPILNIYHNDVIAASHAATVGQVNSEHLYYLKSRGLSELEAKQLITKGYLMPILEDISDAGLKKELSNVLEGVI